MIKVENIQVCGFEPAIRGMRNPMDSWDKSDSGYKTDDEGNYLGFVVGDRDDRLARTLIREGSPNRKFLRQVEVYMDITAPLYWWKEFDTYKVGTVANSCSTMHKIHARPFGLSDFSIDQLHCDVPDCFYDTLDYLNESREKYLETKDKRYWWKMIQLLPTSYNQKRTILLNYEVLVGMYRDRKNHKLDEWHKLCEWIESLSYADELICGKGDRNEDNRGNI